MAPGLMDTQARLRGRTFVYKQLLWACVPGLALVTEAILVKRGVILKWLGTPCVVFWQTGGVVKWRSVSLTAELLSGFPSSEEPLEGTTAEPFLGEKSGLGQAWVLVKNLARSFGCSRLSLVSRPQREERVKRSKQALGL